MYSFISCNINDLQMNFVSKVSAKRTNRPGISTTNRGGPIYRGRGMRSRGYRGSSYMYSGYRPVRRGRYVFY